jgi:tRNA pseudouridine55 synthase
MKAAAWHGLLVLDKPSGITSREAVDRAQRWFPRGTRLGHTGTLDPLATGVLVLCAGVATRLTEYVQRMTKTYRTRVRLGARSDTDDADGTITPCPVEKSPDRDAVQQALRPFIGELEQVPPAFSAAKVTGRRAYALARRGEDVALLPRRVQVHRIDLVAYDYPWLELEVVCGKGTYIRSLARDLGERLGCGGLVETLRRTRVGPFDVGEALSVESDPATARERLLPLTEAVRELPRVCLSTEEATRLRQGQGVRLGDSSLADRLPGEASDCAVFDETGALVAVASLDGGSRMLRPEKVFALEAGASGNSATRAGGFHQSGG